MTHCFLLSQGTACTRDQSSPSSSAENCRIQPNSCEGMTSWRRATETTTPSANVSATIAILVSSDHFRCRYGPLSTSIRRGRIGVMTSLCSSLWSYRSRAMPDHHRPSLWPANGAKTIAHPTTALAGSCGYTAYIRISHVAGIHSSHRAPVIRQCDLLSASTQHSTDWLFTILRRRAKIFNAGSEGHLSCAAKE